MAVNKPSAVAIRASAIPGATVARLAFIWIPISWNEIIMPQTVPNKPINGATEAVVARKPFNRSKRMISSFDALNNDRCMLSLPELRVFSFPGLS